MWYHRRLLLGCEQGPLVPLLALMHFPIRCVVLGFKRSPPEASRLTHAQFAYGSRSPDRLQEVHHGDVTYATRPHHATAQGAQAPPSLSSVSRADASSHGEVPSVQKSCQKDDDEIQDLLFRLIEEDQSQLMLLRHFLQIVEKEGHGTELLRQMP